MNEKDKYARLLHEGEIILWEGRPGKRLLPPRRDMLVSFLVYVLISLVFIPWEGGSWNTYFIAMGFLSFFALLFLPFYLMTINRRAAREIYLLTDRRVMTVVMESTGPALQDVRLLRKLDRLSIQREGKDCATIYIGPQTKFAHYHWLFVPEGEAVAEMIRMLAGFTGNIRRK